MFIYNKKEWCRGAELNCRHHDFQSDAAGPLASALLRKPQILSVNRSARVRCDPQALALDCLPFVYQDVGLSLRRRRGAVWRLVVYLPVPTRPAALALVPSVWRAIRDEFRNWVVSTAA